MLETNKSFMFSSSAPPSRPVDHLTSQKPLLQSRSYYRPSFEQQQQEEQQQQQSNNNSGGGGSSSNGGGSYGNTSSYTRHDMVRHPEELYKLHNHNIHTPHNNNSVAIKHSFNNPTTTTTTTTNNNNNNNNNRPVYPNATQQQQPSTSATAVVTNSTSKATTATTTTTTATTSTTATTKSPALYMDFEEQAEWYEQQPSTSNPSSSSFYEFTDSGDQKARKQRELTSRMKKLNSDFLENKERIYSEKLISVDKELREAKTETHIFYLDSLKELEQQRQNMIEKSRVFREYQEQVTDNQFRLEIYQAEEEYMAETQEIRDKLFATLEEKRRKLKEDKDNCDLAYDVVLESQSRLHKRNLRKRVPENTENKLSKRKQMNGPAFVFRLKDEEIQADLLAMQSLSVKGKK